MADITIKVSKLYEMAKQLKDNKEELVIISITDEDEMEAWDIPASINFKATSLSEPDWTTDYDSIYAFDSE